MNMISTFLSVFPIALCSCEETLPKCLTNVERKLVEKVWDVRVEEAGMMHFVLKDSTALLIV